MNKLYWWVYIVWLSVRKCFDLNLGDLVVHEGREWMLVQGVARPRWDLAKPCCRKNGVHESEFRKVKRIDNYWRSFRGAYKFYMTSWYSIWCREGIKPWMLGCNIWGK